MDLSEWIEQKKRDDKGFSRYKMAYHLGVERYTLTKIARANYVCTPQLAWKIEKYTKGKVRAWEDIILKALKHKEELKQQEQEQDKDET